MSSMRLGKGPKRFRTGEERRRQKGSGQMRSAETATRVQTVPPTEGPVSIFLDDERPCPEGYTLARSPAAFDAIVEAVGGERVAHMALDWHLGCGIEDGIAVATRLADRMTADPKAFPALTIVSLHSSDHGKAREMHDILETGLKARDPELPEVHVVRCSAEETVHVKRLLR